MRRGSVCALVLLIAVAATFGLDLTAFRQSYSRASRAAWYLSSDAGVSNRNDYLARQHAGLSAALYWRAAILSDNFDLDATVSAGASGSGNSGGVPDTLPPDAREWVAGADLHSIATCHAYLFGTDAFVRSGLEGWGSAHASDERIGSELERSRELDADLWDGELGVGYGRMRDAWPLYRAARLTRILEEEGVLARELSDDDLRDLGGFLSRAWKLFYAHNRAAKFYYDSLEQWLMRAGAISEPLPAYTLFRLDEAPLIGTDTRRFGMRGFFTANVEGHRRTEWIDEDDSAWVELDTSFRRSYQVGWEFSRPVGLRGTYAASASYALPWPRQPDMGMQHQFKLGGSASYDITDRLLGSYDIDFQPLYQAPVQPDGIAQLSLPTAHTLGFSYYVSERFAVRLGALYEVRINRYDDRYNHRIDLHRRWAMALTMTFGRIPSGWGVHNYL
jgi:hypothetical protein